MAGASREQILSLIAAAKNHGDLAVKLSSLKQVKEVLLSVGPSFAGELFPYIVELQSSPETLVRKSLVELIEELGLKIIEHSSVMIPVLLSFLKDGAPVVVRQSIVSGKKFFCSVLEKMALQFHQSGRVERWLEDLWMWMVKFKDAVWAIALEPASAGTKILAMKFLEMCFLLFTSDSTDSEASVKEGKAQSFSISWVVGRHPTLDPALLMLEANRCLGLFLDLLQSVNNHRGSLIITVINCLAAIGRKRPRYYSKVLSAFLGFEANFGTTEGFHAASVQYSIRIALLGFLRCSYPAIVESRDGLLRALRAMNAGDAADQVMRQVEKMLKNTERASRDARLSKEDQPSIQLISGDLSKKRSMLHDNEGLNNCDEVPAKRSRDGPMVNLASHLEILNYSEDEISANGVSSKAPLLDGSLTPVEQMIAMIGALLAEGERGAESLEILISTVHPDMLADIVIANMKNLPRNPPTLTNKIANVPLTSQAGSSSSSSQAVVPAVPISMQSQVLTAQVAAHLSSATATSASLSEVSAVTNLQRDPRRDPRRLDPRRVPLPTSLKEEAVDMQCGFDGSVSSSRPFPVPVVTKVEHTSLPLLSKSDMDLPESSLIPENGRLISKEEALDETDGVNPSGDLNVTLDNTLSPVRAVDEDQLASIPLDIPEIEGMDASYVVESDQHSPAASSTSESEETSHNLPLVPLYIELTEEQHKSVNRLAIERIIESYKHLRLMGFGQTRMELLARLVAQTDNEDVIMMLQKHLNLDYKQHKGHEVIMHVLYHLHALTISGSDEDFSHAASVYEKVLLEVAKSLRDMLPASDKSFSKLLGEVPFLPDSALILLEDLCYSVGPDHHGKDVRDGDRVTQGLGAVWSLILGRPATRQACLEIALKCAVHSQDDVRAKAIRLVANKLYLLSYLSDDIERFATDMLLSVVDQHVPDSELSQTTEQTTEGDETSVSGFQVSEPGTSENDSVKGIQTVLQNVQTVSLSQAQRCMALFFALCTKKPGLIQLIFDIYGRATKSVKQAVHRHIPILLRTLGSSYSELLHIISNPPQGSENLLMLVLQILTEETTPSADLIGTIKHLYDTKLKDAAILIPMLSSLSKEEVLPIFPRLVDLPLEKFQAALARILQGSAHTGPALTPAEVLVAIHGITPEKDGLPLKKITDACSACFEQRTVFTQQVLEKALNQLVDQTPLPLLFMRTVIQAIDAFPTLVDFVMEILSKLVTKQIWKMPKLWVGFLKCAAQTQPHSFHVLLQLPPPQLESALNRHSNLKGPLAAHASQPSIRTSLSRSTLVVLGLANESHVERSYIASSLRASDTSSIHGTTLT